MQSKTSKEVVGFFTADGEMMILPNGDNSYDQAETSDQYVDGDITYNIYPQGGNMFVGYYDSNGTRYDRQIIGHYHTHPFSDDPSIPSPDDIGFTGGTFAAIGNFYIVNGNGIYQYDSTGKINSEFKNCKNNPDSSDCD